MLLNLPIPNVNKNNLDIPHPDVGDLIFLLTSVLENYKQIIGCSMDAVPEISDMRITRYIESQYQYFNEILFHGRFKDDGLIIFDETKEEIFEILTSVTTVISILITFEIS